MNKSIQCLFVFVAVIWIGHSESARVLGLYPTPSQSHLIIQMEIIKLLANSGHDVTVVTTLPLSDQNPNYRHVKTPETPVPDEMFNQMIDTAGIWESFKATQYAFACLLECAENSTANIMKTEIMNESFDLIVFGLFMNDFVMGFAGHFKCPMVIIDTHKPFKPTNMLIGNPEEIAYVPNEFLGESQPMSFVARVKNVFFYGLVSIMTEMLRWDTYSKYEKYFPSSKYPPYDEVVKNISLMLHTSYFTEGVIRPTVPAFIQIGGIQTKPKPDPLPKDLAEILDAASEHGAIFFSLGTNAKSSHRNRETMRKVFNVLRTLKQTVLWKWEDENVPGTAPNIIYRKWLPQNDILAHPSTRLFISHCGLGSVVEAKYYGVTILAMPLFGDQFESATSMVKDGFAVEVNYLELTEESLTAALKEVLTNSSYRENIQTFSRLYRDRPMSAQATAEFWLEYVIRHKGAKHLQSPAVHMSAVAYYGLDVMGFLGVILFVIYKTMKCSICWLWRKVCGRATRKSKND